MVFCSHCTMDKISNNSREEMKERFLQELLKTVDKQEHYTILTEEKYKELLREIREASRAAKKTTLQYRRIKRFDIIEIDGVEKIIAKKTSDKVLYYLQVDQVFDVVERCHLDYGHCGRDKLRKETCKNYANITITMINLFLSTCRVCQDRKSKRKSACANDLVAARFAGSDGAFTITYGWIDVVDMSEMPSGGYNFIFVYKNLKTEFVQLRPLKDLSPATIAFEMRNMFLIFGVPTVLRCRNSSVLNKETVDPIINQLYTMWPKIKIINGNAMNSDRQHSLTDSIKMDVLNWTSENDTLGGWRDGVYFVQFAMNNRFSVVLGQTPFEATFGLCTPKGFPPGISVSEEDLSRVNTEEELLEFIKKRRKALSLKTAIKCESGSLVDENEFS